MIDRPPAREAWSRLRTRLVERVRATIADATSGGISALVWRIVASLGVVAVAYYAIRHARGKLESFYAVDQWLVWPMLTMVGWALWLSLGCVSFGFLLIDKVFRAGDRPTVEVLATSFALGLVGFVFGIYLSGILHILKPWFAIALPLGMLLAGAWPLRRFAKARMPASVPLPSSVFVWGLEKVALAFGIIGLLAVYMGAATPDAINFDATWCHVPIAADYARAHRIVPFEGDYARTVPQLASIVQVYAFLVPKLQFVQLRWMLVLMLEVMVFAWTLVGIAAMARYLLGEDPESQARMPRGLWAATFLFPAIFVYDSNLGGAADHYLAMFVAPAFVATMRALDEDFPWRKMLLAGLLAGGALHTKYQAVYIIFGIGLVVGGVWCWRLGRRIWRHLRPPAQPTATTRPSAPQPAPALRSDTEEEAPISTLETEPSALAAKSATPARWRELAESLRPLVLGPLAFFAGIAIASSPHFIKNYLFYGNPVYPFALDSFASHPTHPGASDLFENLFKDWHWRPTGTFKENLKNTFDLCFSFWYEPHYSFTKNRPNFGFLFPLVLPIIVFVKGKKRLIAGAVAALGALFAWGMVFRVDRHLQTFAPLIIATTIAILARAWQLGLIARFGAIALVASQLTWGLDAFVYSNHTRVKSAIDLFRGGFEGRKLEDRVKLRSDYVDLGRSLPKNAKILLHNFRPNLGIDRDIVMDWPGQQGLIFYGPEINSPGALHDYWVSKGITHLVHIPGRRPTVTKQDDVLFSEYVKRYGLEKKRFGGFEVVKLATKTPSHKRFLVLSLGVGGYRSGVFPVEALNTYEGSPPELLKWNRPDTPVAIQLDQIEEALTLVDAVIVGRAAKLTPEMEAAIGGEFEASAQYGAGLSIRLVKGGASAAKPSSASPGSPPESPEENEENP